MQLSDFALSLGQAVVIRSTAQNAETLEWEATEDFGTLQDTWIDSKGRVLIRIKCTEPDASATYIETDIANVFPV